MTASNGGIPSDEVKNFFNSVQSPFSELVNGKIDTLQFLEASRGVVSLVDQFGNVFAPVKYDMTGNIELDGVGVSVSAFHGRGPGSILNLRVDATHVNAVIFFMDEYFKDQETHCELIFGPTSCMEYTHAELQTIYEYAQGKGLQCRWFSGNKEVDVFGRFLCVSRYFSPQALQRYLLAESGDTIRYRLFPPQGPKTELLVLSGQYSPNIIKSIDGQSSPEKSHRDCPHSQGDCHCDHRWNQPEPPGLDWGPTNDQSHQTSQPRHRSRWGPTNDQSNQRFQSSSNNSSPRFQGPKNTFPR